MVVKKLKHFLNILTRADDKVTLDVMKPLISLLGYRWRVLFYYINGTINSLDM